MKKVLFTVALTTYIILILSTTVLGFTPKLVTKIKSVANFLNLRDILLQIAILQELMAILY